MTSKQAVYLQVKVRELFPPDDSLVPPLLRLMPAVNDLRTLQKIWFYAHTRVGDTPTEQDIIKTEDHYLFRLTCATLYETALAFEDLRESLSTSAGQKTVEKMHDDGRGAFYALQNLFPQGFVDQTGHGKILVKLRNSILHYAESRVVRAELLEHGEVGGLILGGVVGASRYLLADDLQIQILVRLLGGSFQEQLKNLMDLVLAATGYFGELVDAMVLMYVQAHGGSVLEQREDSVDLERLWNITPERI